MFIHNFRYAFKTLFRNRMLIFWTFAFPIILGVFFNMAFSSIESSEKLEIIDIAIVDNEDFNNNQAAKETFKILSEDGSENQLFHTEYVDEKAAAQLLEDEKITGYILAKGETVKVVVTSSGINETILKSAVDQIQQINKIVTMSAEKQIGEQMASGNRNIDYEKIYAEAISIATNQEEANIKDISADSLSYIMIEFYTLIAMACLYGGIIGMVAMNQNLPNMTNIGKRVGVSPVSKMKLVLGSVLAGYIIQLIGILILFLFTVFILKVDYGNNLPLIVVLAMAGCLAGLSIGIAVGTLVKSGENTKTGIVIAVTMAGCFLSGMMGVTMKYIIDTHVPFLNKINPASMITDGFYSLYYYDTLDRYFFNLASLLIFAAIMICLSFAGLRRQTYDSI
ncbi:MAG: ABC transporter permease [Eubacterium sp.]